MTKNKKNPAAVHLGKRAGAKRLLKGGRQVFVDMANQSWKHRPKPKHPKEYYQNMKRLSDIAKAKKKKELET